MVLAVDGELEVRGEGTPFERAAGVLTGPDVPHAIEAEGREIVLVFFDPESRSGAALRRRVEGGVRRLSGAERDLLVADPLPTNLDDTGAVDWHDRICSALRAELEPRRPVHPKVRAALRAMRDAPPDADLSLESLADAVGLSSGRFMHAFTESVGIPLRPYLAWLKVQRAAGAILRGATLAEAALAAGFSDAAHMSRTFRRMLGVSPSELQGS